MLLVSVFIPCSARSLSLGRSVGLHVPGLLSREPLMDVASVTSTDGIYMTKLL